MRRSVPVSTDGAGKSRRRAGTRLGEMGPSSGVSSTCCTSFSGWWAMYNVTFFSWRCPSRGAVNVPHHCLFKEDGVCVGSNGKSNPKSQVFSGSGYVRTLLVKHCRSSVASATAL